MICKECHATMTGRKRQYCNTACRQEARTKRWSATKTMWCTGHQAVLPRREFSPRITRQQCRTCSTAYDRKRSDALKIRAIDLLGGVCVDCGFDKCTAALDFHHIDPSIKTMDWRGMRKKSWETIQEIIQQEACVLVCANCHRIRHHACQDSVFT